MIWFRGKAQKPFLKTILWVSFWVLASPLEPLEADDFSKN